MRRWPVLVGAPVTERAPTEAEKRDATEASDIAGAIVEQAGDGGAKRRAETWVGMPIDTEASVGDGEDDATRRARAWKRHDLEPPLATTWGRRCDVYGTPLSN